jgi:hypothetical protein
VSFLCWGKGAMRFARQLSVNKPPVGLVRGHRVGTIGSRKAMVKNTVEVHYAKIKKECLFPPARYQRVRAPSCMGGSSNKMQRWR